MNKVSITNCSKLSAASHAAETPQPCTASLIHTDGCSTFHPQSRPLTRLGCSDVLGHLCFEEKEILHKTLGWSLARDWSPRSGNNNNRNRRRKTRARTWRSCASKVFTAALKLAPGVECFFGSGGGWWIRLWAPTRTSASQELPPLFV